MALTNRFAHIIFTTFVFWLSFAGCALMPGSGSQRESLECRPEFLRPGADRIVIYFYRQANYSGGGRIHILQLDDRKVGDLTADNYYKLTLWPGQYFFAVFLPEEEFLGQTSPPMTIGEQVDFQASDSGNIFTYQYTDGSGTGGFKLDRVTTPSSQLLSDRILGAELDARETAQVTEFFGARYDGPAIHNRPHGLGTLTFSDGSRYHGFFEHGIATNKARFYFKNGTVFMGVFHRGRPLSPGVLMTPCGGILFAGQFLDEQPHGVGLRSGQEFPEFCVYDHGRDVTKSFRQLAREILDEEDQAQIEAFVQQKNGHASPPFDETEYAAAPGVPGAEEPAGEGVSPPSENADQAATPPHQPVEQPPDSHVDKMRTKGKLIEELRRTRLERELVKVMELKNDHRERIEEERSWCREEFALGRRLCRCAPFEADSQEWTECTESFGGRHSIERASPESGMIK